jgi:hypothetical protein
VILNIAPAAGYDIYTEKNRTKTPKESRNKISDATFYYLFSKKQAETK